MHHPVGTKFMFHHKSNQALWWNSASIKMAKTKHFPNLKIVATPSTKPLQEVWNFFWKCTLSALDLSSLPQNIFLCGICGFSNSPAALIWELFNFWGFDDGGLPGKISKRSEVADLRNSFWVNFLSRTALKLAKAKICMMGRQSQNCKTSEIKATAEMFLNKEWRSVNISEVLMLLLHDLISNNIPDDDDDDDADWRGLLSLSENLPGVSLTP